MTHSLNSFISLLSILLGVAFYTILERKIMSYTQLRKGPNKVGMNGTFQPFADALKLFNKNLSTPELTNPYLFLLTPPLNLILSFLLISIIPLFVETPFDNMHSILLFMVISSLNVLMIMLMGWAANSKFTHMGAIRSMAQMISYEVSMFLILIFISILTNSYNFTQISETQTMMWFITGNSLLFCIWMITILAEVNRSPFDFAEGESELVSGFNIEYMGGWFTMIFLAEYANMIILSMLTLILFMKFIHPLSTPIFLLITTLILWIRSTYPRYRYDMLMSMSWKTILPTSLFLAPFPTLFSMWSL